MAEQSRILAVLGPTNTGKTHYAIERMLGHRTGIIGLPLRLLAREVYDRIVSLRGPSVVALVTMPSTLRFARCSPSASARRAANVGTSSIPTGSTLIEQPW